VIALGQRILQALGIADRVVLELNTLGDPASRQHYRTGLISYFSSHVNQLSEDSRRRLGTNPLRILDSKDSGDKEIVNNAPILTDYMTPASQKFFMDVKGGLDRIGINYNINPHLVRGLDYYTHTVFEFITTDLGAQGTVLAGGRYDGLVELMGGPAMAGVGWAAGIERLAMLIAEPPPPRRPVAVIPLGSAAEIYSIEVAEEIRNQEIPVELGYSGNLQRQLGRATHRFSARAAVIIGDNEINKESVSLLDLDNRRQEMILKTDLITRLKALYG
jgi:histidyl-tRNA synthetase